MAEPRAETTTTSALPNLAYHAGGLALLFLNKIRHTVQGYTTPRTFPITQFQRAIEYDFRVVDHWVRHLGEYTASPATLTGKTILELGPGADLGIGLITLMRGARKYNAMDVHNLVQSVPDRFYDELFRAMRREPSGATVDEGFLRSQLAAFQRGRNDRLNYVCRSDFDLTAFRGEGIDLVLSQAAFEHFDDVDRTVEQLSKIVRPGAILIAEVDLQTHTRWIRDRDPLNIYRYPDAVYGLFKFTGSPNRLRPYEYREILRKHGWGGVRVIPLTRLEPERLARVQGLLNRRFRDPVNEMDYLSIMLCATKS